MSIQQSINQNILTAGALYSQSGAAEQRKEKLADIKYSKNLQENLKTQKEDIKNILPEVSYDPSNPKETYEASQITRNVLPKFEDFFDVRQASLQKGQEYFLNKGNLKEYSALKTAGDITDK